MAKNISGHKCEADIPLRGHGEVKPVGFNLPEKRKCFSRSCWHCFSKANNIAGQRQITGETFAKHKRITSEYQPGFIPSRPPAPPTKVCGPFKLPSELSTLEAQQKAKSLSRMTRSLSSVRALPPIPEVTESPIPTKRIICTGITQAAPVPRKSGNGTLKNESVITAPGPVVLDMGPRPSIASRMKHESRRRQVQNRYAGRSLGCNLILQMYVLCGADFGVDSDDE